MIVCFWCLLYEKFVRTLWNSKFLFDGRKVTRYVPLSVKRLPSDVNVDENEVQVSVYTRIFQTLLNPSNKEASKNQNYRFNLLVGHQLIVKNEKIDHSEICRF